MRSWSKIPATRKRSRRCNVQWKHEEAEQNLGHYLHPLVSMQEPSTPILYRRGYILSRRDVDLPERGCGDWTAAAVGDWRVYHAPDYAPLVVDVESATIIAFGILLDPVREIEDASTILDDLLQSWQVSKENFLARLDTLSGRFVLFVDGADETIAVQDACGMRTCFYTTGDEPLLSSHSELIADVRNLSPSEDARRFMATDWFRGNRDRHFPGLRTPYATVKRLTPNTYLDVENREVTRFYPRESIPKHSTQDDAVIRKLSDVLVRQSEMLNRQRPICVPVTAGIDSRLTLATLRGLEDEVETFTFVYDDASRKEAPIARDLCETLGFSHRIIPCDREAPPSFIDDFSKNTSQVSSQFRGQVAATICAELDDSHIHLKSNVSEVGRAYYHEPLLRSPSIDPILAAQLYAFEHPFTVEAFDEFIQKTAFADSSDIEPYDLFYWEARMGNWVALSCLEWDAGPEMIMPYNNRWLLEHLLGFPLSKRRKGHVHRELVHHVYPESLEIPINAHKSKPIVGAVVDHLHFFKQEVLRQTGAWYRQR